MKGKKKNVFFSFENHKDIWELINELIYIEKD